MTNKTITLDGQIIGAEHPVFLIAEISSNHARDKSVVKKLIDATAETGFDAVKFQTYDPLEVFSGKITTTGLKIDHMYGHRPWWEVTRDHILMPREWFGEMFSYARERNLQVFSTVHSARDAEFVMQFNPPAFKVASLDVTYFDFLADLATFGKPIILSTGMHYLGEIEEAVHTIIHSGNDQVALLHCVSIYPPKPEEGNLNNIPMLQKAFELPVGLSDHHPDNFMDIAAVAMGACIIEKHITLDRNMKGPDHPFALDAEGMRNLVENVRNTEKSLGSYKRVLSKAELTSRTITRRSFVARKDIDKAEIFTPENLKLTRPGTGIHPKYKNQLLGRRAAVFIEKEEIISWEMVD
ncbi:N-acetylneuraminate synthase family protein [candidate division CSSED10-310 bacterium]|uniref:N-acetylneuraminate synthase family protein n=1 Tax=candidate division CSSED10-310 bacterium TaxID=2855610 RepID=A0ABV6Z5B8_UNCC1